MKNPNPEASGTPETRGTFSWGRTRQTKQRVLDLDPMHPAPWAGPAIPYGNGRSYGDSCLVDGGTLLRTRRLDAWIGFDPSTGVLEVESGVRMDQILGALVPRGFFIPITLGTKLITIGGAIGNDIHGKNHHVAGTFGHHVAELELWRSDGRVIRCSPEENADWFAATIGGLGLTGIVRSAKIRLPRVPSGWVRSETIPFADIDEFVDLCEASDRFVHTAAWVDLMNFQTLGRGIFFRGDFCEASRPLPRGLRVQVPFSMPAALLSDPAMRLFNDAYFARNAAKGKAAIVPYDAFFFPLDGIGAWNRMYGRRGFFQYQCVVPAPDARAAMRAVLAYLRDRSVQAYLGVAKAFGAKPSIGMLSFPREGLTLSIDLPNNGARTLAWMDDLDRIVAEAGGAVYPAKDARMSRENFRKFFPRWEAFSRFVDPGCVSDFWRRVG